MPTAQAAPTNKTVTSKTAPLQEGFAPNELLTMQFDFDGLTLSLRSGKRREATRKSFPNRLLLHLGGALYFEVLGRNGALQACGIAHDDREMFVDRLEADGSLSGGRYRAPSAVIPLDVPLSGDSAIVVIYSARVDLRPPSPTDSEYIASVGTPLATVDLRKLPF